MAISLSTKSKIIMEKQDNGEKLKKGKELNEFLIPEKKVAELEAQLEAHHLESKKKLHELEAKLEAQKKVCKVHELERKELEAQLEVAKSKLEVAKSNIKKYFKCPAKKKEYQAKMKLKKYFNSQT